MATRVPLLKRAGRPGVVYIKVLDDQASKEGEAIQKLMSANSASRASSGR